MAVTCYVDSKYETIRQLTGVVEVDIHLTVRVDKDNTELMRMIGNITPGQYVDVVYLELTKDEDG